MLQSGIIHISFHPLITFVCDHDSVSMPHWLTAALACAKYKYKFNVIRLEKKLTHSHHPFKGAKPNSQHAN